MFRQPANARLRLLTSALVAGPALAAFLMLTPHVSAGADRLERLGARQVTLGGEIGRRVEVTIHNNLLKLDVDRDFLKPFQQPKAQGGFIGVGMLLDATVRLANYSRDAKVLALKQRLVDELIRAQQPDGYVGMMAPEARMWRLWDIHEMGYLVYGLTSDYQFFGEKRSLSAACKLADFILRRWAAEPAREPTEGTITTHMAVTGLERTLLTLSAASGDPRYEAFCLGPRQLRQWELPIVIGRWGKIEGHIYAYLAHALAQLQLYRNGPDPQLLGQARRAMDFLCQRDGMVISGAAGDHECWYGDVLPLAGTIKFSPPRKP